MTLDEFPTATHRGAAFHEPAKSARFQGLLAAIPSRSTSRVGALRLAVAAVSLYVILWVSAGTVIAQLAKNTAPSTQVLLTNPNLRTEQPDATQQLNATESASSSTNSPPTVQAKKCEKMKMSHVETEFYRADNCLSRSDIQQIILGLVWTLTDVLTTKGIPYWLDSGTLLGSVREKTVIPYDVDADIGITEASYFQLRDNKFAYPSDTYDLQVLGGKFHRSGPRDENIPARFIHKHSGLYVDIFVFLDNKSDPAKFGPIPSVCFAGCFRCPKLGKWIQEFTIPRDWVYPLQECAFGGRNVSCPAKPEKYLDYLYGEKFMTPFVISHVEGDFYDPKNCFSRVDIQQIILRIVWALADTSKRNDIPYWLDSGTTQRVPRQDRDPARYDADVGIDETTYIKLRDTDLKLGFPSVYELQVFEAKNRKHDNQDPGIPSRLVHTKSGMYVDIFVFLESKTAASDQEPMFGPIPSGCFGGCKHYPEVESDSYES